MIIGHLNFIHFSLIFRIALLTDSIKPYECCEALQWLTVTHYNRFLFSRVKTF